MLHPCTWPTRRHVVPTAIALLSMALSVLAPTSLSPAKADVVIYSNGVTIRTTSDSGLPDRYNRYPASRYRYPASGPTTVIVDPDYYRFGGNSRRPTRIENSTLVNPVLIDSTVRDSTLINPILIDSTVRNSTIITTPSQPRYQSHCLNHASIRIACRNE